MRYLAIILMLIISITFACTPEKTIFEKETWWSGHWQNTSDTTVYFSSGQKSIGGNEIVKPQFFISTSDTILDNFYLEELVDFDHNNNNKLIKTSDDTYIKLQEIDESHIDVHGPVSSMNEINSVIDEYRRLPEGADAPIPDSILFDL